MQWDRWRVPALLTGAAVVALALGIGAGTLYANMRQRAQDRAHLEERQTYLQSSLRNLNLGERFPDLALSDAATGSVVGPGEFLPNGGVAVVLSAECPSCYGALLELDAVVRENSPNALEVAVIVAGDSHDLQQFADSMGVSCRLFEDSEQKVLNEYGVLVFPAYFTIDSQRIVQAMGADASTRDALEDVIAL